MYKNGPNAYACRIDVDQPERTAKNRISFMNAHNRAYLIIQLAFFNLNENIKSVYDIQVKPETQFKPCECACVVTPGV